MRTLLSQVKDPSKPWRPHAAYPTLCKTQNTATDEKCLMLLCCAESLPGQRCKHFPLCHSGNRKISHIFILNGVLFSSFSFCFKGQRVLCKIERDSPCRAAGNYSTLRENIWGSKWQNRTAHGISKTKKEIERNPFKSATKRHFKQSLKGVKKS